MELPQVTQLKSNKNIQEFTDISSSVTPRVLLKAVREGDSGMDRKFSH